LLVYTVVPLALTFPLLLFQSFSTSLPISGTYLQISAPPPPPGNCAQIPCNPRGFSETAFLFTETRTHVSKTDRPQVLTEQLAAQGNYMVCQRLGDSAMVAQWLSAGRQCGRLQNFVCLIHQPPHYCSQRNCRIAVRFLAGTKIYLFSTASRPAPGPTERSVQRVPRALSPGREANHSPPSRAEVKNGGTIPSLSHMSSWHSA
jgi:hypothetical protein